MFLASCALGACESGRQVEERLVAAFGETMFDAGTAPHGPRDARPDRDFLARWSSPVEVAIIEGDTAANRALAQRSVAEMATLSGVQMVWLDAGNDDAELTIHFSADREFVINGNELARCYSRIATGRDGTIVAAEVHIAQAAPGEWRVDCLTHELLHAFGWRGHTHRIRSAISYAHGEAEMTEWDRLMMRALYDPRLQPGIARDDALPVVRDILHGLLEE